MATRRLGPGGYSALGALAGLGGIAAAGTASVAVQVGGLGWWALAVLCIALCVGLLWLAARLLRLGRLNPPGAGRAVPPDVDRGGP